MGRARRAAGPLALVLWAVLALPAAAGAADPAPLGTWGEELGRYVESVAAAEDGSIAATDRTRDRVVVFGYDRAVRSTFEAEDPRGIAAVPGGGYVVAERDGARRVDAAGATLATYAAREPYGVAVTGDTVLIADARDGRILRYALDGTRLEAWDADLRSARGLAVGADGTVFAADHGRWRVETFSAAGAPTGGWRVADPHGVAVGPDGTVYVATNRAHRLEWFDAAGTPLGRIATWPSHPRGVAVDCRGTVTISSGAPARLSAYGDPAAEPPPCVEPPPPPPPAPLVVAAPPPPPGPEQPVLGQTAAATPVDGVVFVGEGAMRRPLDERTIVPVESQIDATQGEVELVFETVDRGRMSGRFSEGSFTIHQGTAQSLVELRLTGELAVPGDASAAIAGQRKRKRRVWGSATGEFKTTGRHGAASVRGTRWLTEDRPTGTFIRVVEGTVLAEAFERDVRRILRAGDSFLARPACVSRRRFRIRLRAPVGTTIRSASVHVEGRRAKLVRGRRFTAPIDLRGLPQGVADVRIRIVTANGTVLRETREYRTCAGARG